MSRTALIVVDMINPYDHPDAEKLTASAREAVPAMSALIDRAAEEDVLTIYVNDNFGAWNSDRDELVETALHSALDAHIRHLDVVVPPDACAHIHEDLAEAALRMMELNMGAEPCSAESVSFD
ncbi:MAG: Nicotinamidase [uncultured Solirubrobacteraceae bacterium]|uniref:Nicotinamidase n=1 Tax=uncultured Solirubrobacteraceae bacterium TaxID=1162706 RepID=A0A6J4SFI9_9ACTN|nr:MAG: Nicotinamidase [uncultured Solirubrobacteraceae bacterium]